MAKSKFCQQNGKVIIDKPFDGSEGSQGRIGAFDLGQQLASMQFNASHVWGDGHWFHCSTHCPVGVTIQTPEGPLVPGEMKLESPQKSLTINFRYNLTHSYLLRDQLNRTIDSERWIWDNNLYQYKLKHHKQEQGIGSIFRHIGHSKWSCKYQRVRLFLGNHSVESSYFPYNCTHLWKDRLDHTSEVVPWIWGSNLSQYNLQQNTLSSGIDSIVRHTRHLEKQYMFQKDRLFLVHGEYVILQKKFPELSHSTFRRIVRVAHKYRGIRLVAAIWRNAVVDIAGIACAPTLSAFVVWGNIASASWTRKSFKRFLAYQNFAVFWEVPFEGSEGSHGTTGASDFTQQFCRTHVNVLHKYLVRFSAELLSAKHIPKRKATAQAAHTQRRGCISMFHHTTAPSQKQEERQGAGFAQSNLRTNIVTKKLLIFSFIFKFVTDKR